MAGLSVNLTPSGSTSAGSTDFSISCIVTVLRLKGSPSITWMDPDGMTISNGDDFTVGDVTGSGPMHSSVLTFNSLKTSQAGEYTCSAELDSETAMFTATVSVTSKYPLDEQRNS